MGTQEGAQQLAFSNASKPGISVLDVHFLCAPPDDGASLALSSELALIVPYSALNNASRLELMIDQRRRFPLSPHPPLYHTTFGVYTALDLYRIFPGRKSPTNEESSGNAKPNYSMEFRAACGWSHLVKALYPTTHADSHLTPLGLTCPIVRRRITGLHSTAQPPSLICTQSQPHI